MVMDKPKRQQMTAFDWSVLGHGYDPERCNLPRCRVDIPLGPSADDLHVVANRLAQLAENLHMAARATELGTSHRAAILDAKGQIWQTHRALREIKLDWERELRCAGSGAMKNKKHLREVG